jgi:hypothetical protein
MFGQSTISPDLLNNDEMISKLVGSVTLADILVDDVPCRCLVDTGSQVTTISQRFYLKHLSYTTLQPVESCLKVIGAGGQEVPYLGYIAVDVTLPQDDLGDSQCFSILVLVVPDTSFHTQAPVLLGTSGLCHPTAWKHVYQCFATVGSVVEQGVLSQKSQCIPAHNKALILGRVQTSILPQ